MKKGDFTYICIMLQVTLVVHDEQAKEGLKPFKTIHLNSEFTIKFIF